MTSPAIKKEEWNQEPQSDKKAEIIRAMEVSTGEGPGRFLKALREFAEISELEAASRINISLNQLRALELDQFDMLPAPIYVRNYLRRYAELLSIPYTAVQDAYERCGESVDPVLQRVSLRDSINSRHISMRWATYSVIALLLVLMVVWGQSPGFGEFFKRFDTSDTVNPSGPAMLELPALGPDNVDSVPTEDIAPAE